MSTVANLLAAVQTCAHFMHASSSKVAWPLQNDGLRQLQRDEDLFEALAALNERFAKPQDTLGAAMRHSALFMSETPPPFLRVPKSRADQGLAQLADRLLASLSADSDLDEAWSVEAERRLAELENGSVIGVPIADVNARACNAIHYSAVEVAWMAVAKRTEEIESGAVDMVPGHIAMASVRAKLG